MADKQTTKPQDQTKDKKDELNADDLDKVSGGKGGPPQSNSVHSNKTSPGNKF